MKASYICFVSSYTSEVMRCLYMGVKFGLSLSLSLSEDRKYTENKSNRKVVPGLN
jgi:hypothetical protein